MLCTMPESKKNRTRLLRVILGFLNGSVGFETYTINHLIPQEFQFAKQNGAAYKGSFPIQYTGVGAVLCPHLCGPLGDTADAP